MDTEEEAQQRLRARATRATWIMEIVGCCRILAEDAVEGMDWSFERALDHAFYTHRVYLWEAARDRAPPSAPAAEQVDVADQPSPGPVEAT